MTLMFFLFLGIWFTILTVVSCVAILTILIFKLNRKRKATLEKHLSVALRLSNGHHKLGLECKGALLLLFRCSAMSSIAQEERLATSPNR